MRVLVTCWPFEGHVYPQLAIALALQEAGHEVAFYTGPGVRPVVEGAGVRFFGFSQVDSSRYERVQSREAETGSRRQSLRVEHQAFRDWLVETIPGQVSDLRAVVASWPPNVLLTDLSMWGPLLVVGEMEDIPVVGSSTFLGPMIPGPQAPPWGFGLAPRAGVLGAVRDSLLSGVVSVVARGLRRRVDQIRAEYGLPPLGMSVNAYTGTLPLYLVPGVRELDYSRTDLPSTVHYVGPCPWFPPVAGTESEWLEGVPRDLPWIHVTEGTSHYQDPFLLRAAVRGLADSPVRVIGTTGARRDPAALGLGRTAATVHLTPWLSHDVLLPRCRVVVTTGGPATIRAALGAGVPLVVVPTTWDKPDNARRVAEAGVGVRLAPGRCSPERLRAAVLSVLGDDGFTTRAREMADRFAQAPGPARAVELVEDLVRTRDRAPASQAVTNERNR